MIPSLFSVIKEDITKDHRIANLKSHLQKIGALKKFNEIYEDYGQNAERVIAYLIFTYSFDSTFVVSDQDWKTVKEGIMELVGLDTEEFSDVISIQKQSVKTAILYLSKEVKDWRYYQTIVWKESCQILDEIATQKPDSKNKSGARNVFDAAKYSYDLKERVAKLEQEIKQTSRNQERLKEVSELNIENISMERLLKEMERN